jgi:ferritin-like metal-binding protein YciE
MKRRSLHDLFIEELRDVYSAEKQLVKALPKLAKAATSPELRDGFLQHHEETQRQVERLEEVFQAVGHKPKAKTCDAMEGLVLEAKDVIDLKAEPEVIDAGLIAAAQKVEHYEIAAYGSLCAWAEHLHYGDARRLLHETLEEEKRTDAKLTELAQREVNASAAASATPAVHANAAAESADVPADAEAEPAHA